MVQVEEIVGLVEEQLDELEQFKASKSNSKEKRDAIVKLIATYRRYKTGSSIESLAKVVFCGWILSGLDESKRSQLRNYRESELRILLITGFDQYSMDLCLRVKDHLFAVGFPIDEADADVKIPIDEAEVDVKLLGHEFGELLTECVERVKDLVHNADGYLKNFISSCPHDTPDLTCKQLLNMVEEKFTPNRLSPLLALDGQNLITVKHGAAKAAALRSSGIMDTTGIITLKEWVGLNDTNIIKFFDIPNEVDKAPFLSLDAKKILRSLAYELRLLHNHGYIHGGLSMETILIRKHDMGVGLLPSFQQGDPKTDHDALREIVKSLIGDKLDLVNYPGELADFVHNEKSHLMYFHAAFMSPYDKINLIEQFLRAADNDGDFKGWLRSARFVSESSGETSLGEGFYNNRDRYQFLTNFYFKHSLTYRKYPDEQKPLVFIRDGLHHMDQYVSDATDTVELSILRNVTMSELVCGNYLSQVMELIIDKLEDGTIVECELIKNAIYGHFNLNAGAGGAA